MSTQALFQSIAIFLQASPEWIENWATAPVCKENPLQVAEIIKNVINCLPYDAYKKASELNPIWRKWVYEDLYRKPEKMEDKYWNLVAKEKAVWKQLDKAWEKGFTEETKFLSKKFEELHDEKCEAFAEQVRVEQAVLDCGFTKNEDEEERINRHINLFRDGFTPNDVGWTRNNEKVYHWDSELEEWDSTYWGDEDPDISNESNEDDI